MAQLHADTGSWQVSHAVPGGGELQVAKRRSRLHLCWKGKQLFPEVSWCSPLYIHRGPNIGPIELYSLLSYSLTI